MPGESTAASLQVADEAWGKGMLLPLARIVVIPTNPWELVAKLNASFHSDPRDALFKALDV